MDAYTGKKKTSSTTKGSAIGADIGALLGYMSAQDKSRRDRHKAMLIGAGIGGPGGAAVGNYMDKQEARLREQIRRHGFQCDSQWKQPDSEHGWQHHLCYGLC